MMRKMVTEVLAVVLAVGLLAPGNLAFAGDHLTVTAFGGASQEGYRKAYFEPFTKATGIKITEDEWNGESAKIRAMVESKTVSWDVVNAGNSAGAMCAEGLLETIEWKRLGVDRAKFGEAGEQTDCGVPLNHNAQGVIYDKGKLPNGPKTIADLFDLRKFPGKRGLWKSPKTNLEWALVADGVPAKDVYKVLGTPEGVDRAFKKLDTIKKDVVWWASGAQSRQLVADGQVVMTADWQPSITADAINKAGKHVGILWDAAFLSVSYWVIPKGDPRLDDAYKFITFASSPQVQADMARLIRFVPGNHDAMALLDLAVLSDMPTAANNPVEYNARFWADRLDELGQRFTAWLAK
ncbi:ABC transporter substrate-binding protein [Bradyrhizobium sp. 521_C7_N1_3]|uniref:ABC transporter substrate-binding protein n=1 Tax=Bradyrhizobium sp. 521_C7_N1_3 TaxID=3240368 RepID=UPI003F8A9822